MEMIKKYIKGLPQRDTITLVQKSHHYIANLDLK